MSDGADVTSVAVTLAWDPAGPLDLGRLTAPVPGTPPYRAKDVLDLSEVRLTEGRISALADGGLHRAACCGDITGHGAISALDGTRVLQEVVGLDRAEIPPLPGIVVPPLGRDPHVQLGSGSGRPGRSVTVPLTLDDAQGLEAADFRLTFDPSRLTLTPQGVRPGPLVAGGTFLVHTPAPGTLTAGLTTPTPRPAGGGTLLTLDFQVPPTAPPGPTPSTCRPSTSTKAAWSSPPAPAPAPIPPTAWSRSGPSRASPPPLPPLSPSPFAFLPPDEGSPREAPSLPTARRMLDELAAAHGFAGPEYDLLAPLRAAPRPAWLRRFLLDLAAPPEALDPNRDLRIDLPPAPQLTVGVAS